MKLLFPVFFAVVFVAAGCTTYKTITVKAHDTFPGVPVSSVKIVDSVPSGSVFMGDIQGKASSTDDASVAAIQEKIRADAAKIGANRIVFGAWHTYKPNDFQQTFFISAKAYWSKY